MTGLKTLCAKGQIYEALQCVHLMHQQGTHVSNIINSLLQACIKKKDLAAGRAVYHFIKSGGLESNTIWGGHLIRLFVVCGSVLEANKVFNQLTNANLSTWNAIISANVKLGQSDVAIDLYHRMQQSSVKPGTRVFVAVLKAYTNILGLVQGKLLHACIIENGYGSDMFVGNTLIDLYAKCECLDDARNVFDKLPNRDVVSWNAMITGYTQNGQGEEASQLFHQMHLVGIEPDYVTYTCVLKACACISALDLGKLVHYYIIEKGNIEDVCVGNTLVDMYSKCGNIDDAKNVFDTLSNKTVVSWNAMIAGHVHHGHVQGALELFQLMQEGCMEPNKITLVHILIACSCIAALDQGKLIHFHIIERGFELDVVVGSTLIDMYAKCGSLHDARVVFEKLHKRDVVMWSAMIAGYTHHGCGHEALDVFKQMQQQGMEPNDVTYVSILNACSCIADLDQGKLIHSHTTSSFFCSHTCVGNALIDMYAKAGSLEDAHNMFDKLPKRSLVTWNTMIAGNIEHGHGEEGLFLFEQMRKEGLEPSTITFSCILKACSSLAALAEGRLIHAHIIKGSFEEDNLITNTLMDMYVKCGSLEDACKMFNKSPKQDVVLWSAMIAGHAQCTDYKQALQYFENMQREGLKPNDVTFVCLLSTCSRAGLVDEGCQHFNSMTKDYGITPTFEHYNCMVDLMGRVGRLIEAENLLQTMPFEPNIVIWTSLLSHCKTHGNVDLGRRCFDIIIKLDSTLASGYVLMCSLYADAGMWEDADEIAELRTALHAWKKPGKAFTEFDNKLHDFLVGDKSHPQKGTIYMKVQRLSNQIADQGYVPYLDSVLQPEEMNDLILSIPL